MAKHSDPDPSSFYRSLGRAFFRAGGAMLVLLVVVLAVAFAALGGVRTPWEPAAPDTTSPTTAVAPGVIEEPQPTRTPVSDPGPTRAASEPATTPNPESETTAPSVVERAKDPSATSVQVLDGVGDPERTQRVVATLKDLGYEIVAVNPAGVDYDTTTVFFTAGFEAEARALRARDGRFVDVGPSPDLSEQVDLHVVVGADWSD